MTLLGLMYRKGQGVDADTDTRHRLAGPRRREGRRRGAAGARHDLSRPGGRPLRLRQGPERCCAARPRRASPRRSSTWGFSPSGAFGNPPDFVSCRRLVRARPPPRAMPARSTISACSISRARACEKNADRGREAHRRGRREGQSRCHAGLWRARVPRRGRAAEREDRRAMAAAVGQARQHHRAEPRGAALSPSARAFPPIRSRR